MSMTTPRTRIAFHPNGRSFLAILFASLFLVGTTVVNVHVITRDITADLVVSTDFLTMGVPQGSRASDVLLWNVSPLCIASDEFAASQHPRGMQFWEYINQTARGIFSYARLHNIFTSPEGDRRGKANAGGDVVQRYENGTLWYNWTIVENVLDAIVSCDIIPYIELSFMPVLLSSQPESAPERREPADYSAWEALVRAFLDIVGSRYGNESLNAWRFEVWNEPDISNFWRDTREGYFRLYNSTARVIKAYSPLLKVGGPALASEIDFLGDFLDFCDGNAVPLDFISFHAKGGSGGSDTYPHHDKVIERIQECVGKIRQHARFNQDTHDIEIFISELDPITGSHVNKEDNPVFEYRDTEYYPAWFVNTLAMVTKLQISLGVTVHGLFSHNLLFPWETRTFFGTRGFITPLFDETEPIPIAIPEDMPLQRCAGVVGKPMFMAAQLVARVVKNESRLLHARLSGFPASSRTINALAFQAKNGTVQVLIAHQEECRFSTAVRSLHVVIQLPPSFSQSIIVDGWYIDRHNNNPFRVWESMGSPARLTTTQIAALHQESVLKKTTTSTMQSRNGSIEMDMVLPPYSVRLVEIRGI